MTEARLIDSVTAPKSRMSLRRQSQLYKVPRSKETSREEPTLYIRSELRFHGASSHSSNLGVQPRGQGKQSDHGSCLSALPDTRVQT